MHVAGLRPSAPLSIYRQPAERNEPTIDVMTLEQPFIQVAIEHDGRRYEQTLERSGQEELALVLVSNLAGTAINGLEVNIIDLKVTPKSIQ